MTDDANNDQQSSVIVDENDDDSNLNASLFEVEAVMDYMYDNKAECDRFKIRWKGYGEKDDTWEPLQSLSEDIMMLALDLKEKMTRKIRRSRSFKGTPSQPNTKIKLKSKPLPKATKIKQNLVRLHSKPRPINSERKIRKIKRPKCTAENENETLTTTVELEQSSFLPDISSSDDSDEPGPSFINQDENAANDEQTSKVLIKPLKKHPFADPTLCLPQRQSSENTMSRTKQRKKDQNARAETEGTCHTSQGQQVDSTKSLLCLTSNQMANEYMKIAVASILQNIGFSTARNSALNNLTSILIRLLNNIAQKSVVIAEKRCQYQANVSVSVSDMFGALSQLNIQPYDILEYTRSLDSFNLPYTVPEFPVKFPEKANNQRSIARSYAYKEMKFKFGKMSIGRASKKVCFDDSLHINERHQHIIDTFPTYDGMTAEQLGIELKHNRKAAELDGTVDSLASGIMAIRKPVKRKKQEKQRKRKRNGNGKEDGLRINLLRNSALKTSLAAAGPSDLKQGPSDLRQDNT